MPEMDLYIFELLQDCLLPLFFLESQSIISPMLCRFIQLSKI